MSEDLEGIEKRIETNKRIGANFGMIGSSGLERYGGTIYEEFLSALRMPDCLKIYKEMGWNDATIGAVLFLFEELARRADWGIQKGGDKPIDIEAADLVEECRNDMEQPFSNYITEALSKFTYGWSIHEIVYKIRRGYSRNPKYNSKYNDGKIGWRSIPGRSQDSWNNWIFNDNTGELKQFEQLVPSTGEIIKIPMEKCLHFRTTANRGNPEGRSLLRIAYRAWFFKKYIEEIEAMGIERELAGLPKLTVAEGLDIWEPNNAKAVALRAEAEKIVANIRRDKNAGLVLPFGWEFDLVTTGGNRQINTNEVLNRYDQRIAGSMLADIIMLGADKVGSFALADVKKSLIAAALEAQVQEIADIFNKYAIPRLLEINGFRIKDLTDFPKLVVGEIEAPDINNVADFLLKLQKLGLNVFPSEKLEKYLNSIAGFPQGSIDSKNNGMGTPDNTDQKIKVVMDGNGKGTKEQYNDLDYKLKVDEKKPHNMSHKTDDKTKFNQIYEEGGRK